MLYRERRHRPYVNRAPIPPLPQPHSALDELDASLLDRGLRGVNVGLTRHGAGKLEIPQGHARGATTEGPRRPSRRGPSAAAPHPDVALQFACQ